jgi:hypothetical protein
MTIALHENYQLKPEQHRRLSAIYTLTPSWKLENKDQQISQTNRSALIHASILGSPARSVIPIFEA